MTGKSLLALFLLAVLSTAGAIWGLTSAPRTFEAGQIDEPAFPTLRAAPDAVRELELESSKESFTLKLTEEGWIAPGKDDFPANNEKIASVIASLSDMRLVARKTERPELYSRLDLDDPGQNPQSAAKHLSLKDGQGKVMAEAYFGKKHWRGTGSEHSGVYLRRPGEKTTWLASGGEILDASLKEWLEDDILDIRAEGLKRIEISPRSAKPYEILRSNPQDPFLLPSLPPGRSVAESELNRVAGTLAGLKHQDVVKRHEAGFSELRDPASLDRAVFVTLDGLSVEVERSAKGEEDWLAFTVTSVEGAEAAIRQEAEALQARLGPWAFKVPRYIGERMATPMQNLLEGDPLKNAPVN